jgi:hypothetical protein
MTTFQGYTCWSVPDALDTISTEAVHPSPEVFLATHAPLKIRKRSLTHTEDGTGGFVSELDVRQDFLGRLPHGRVLLMPVIGETGTGKSHLVRWVKETMPNKPDQRLVYLKKTQTNLSSLVRELLMDMPGQPFDDIRQSIGRITNDLTEHELAEQLLDSLALAIASATPDEGRGDQTALCGEHGLPALLRDPHLRRHFLVPDGPIVAWANFLMAGRETGHDDQSLQFTAYDLPLRVSDPNDASRVARDVWSDLNGSTVLQRAAVDLLNQHMETATLRVSNLGGGKLYDALIQIRRELLGRGEEIVLLIEDFVVGRGVQHDLLDAITETSLRDGDQVLAPIRTLMAVTSGYYDSFKDTIRSRVQTMRSYVYSLDVTLGSDVSDEDMQSFVARYLNAARVGRARLEADPGTRVGQAPNKCEDCAMRLECHDGFGATSDGIGLYPFNRAALLRTIRSRARAPHPDRFNPRTALGEAVQPVLVDFRDQIQEGTFPPPDFRAIFPTPAGFQALSATVAHALTQADPINGDRRSVLLEYWGDAPNKPTNLAAGIHHAFNLPPLPDVDGLKTAPRDRPASQTAADKLADPVDDVPRDLRAALDVVEEWGMQGRQLPQSIARSLRLIVRAAVIRRTDWFDPIMREPTRAETDAAWKKQNITALVYIEGASRDDIPQQQSAPIRFSRDPETVLFFQALLKLERGYPEDTVAAQRRLAAIADAHGRDLRASVRREARIDDGHLEAAVRVSLLGAAVAGRITPTAPLADLVRALVDDGHDWLLGDESLRPPAWRDLLDAHRQHRRELTTRLRDTVGVAQGEAGKPQMIDIARVLPLLERVRREWSWQDLPPDASPWLTAAAQGLKDLPAIARNHAQNLRTVLSEIRQFLPSGAKPAELLAAVREALGLAVAVGLTVDLNDLPSERAFLDRADRMNWEVIKVLDKDLEALPSEQDDLPGQVSLIATTWPTLLQVTATDRGRDLADIREFLSRSHTWIAAATARAVQADAGTADEVVTDLRDVLDRWADMLEEHVDGTA